VIIADGKTQRGQRTEDIARLVYLKQNLVYPVILSYFFKGLKCYKILILVDKYRSRDLAKKEPI